MEERLGERLRDPVELEPWSADEHHGTRDGLIGLPVPSGKVADRDGVRLRTVLRELAADGTVTHLRVTPRQDLLLCGIPALVSVSRDVLAPPDAPRLNTDQPVLELTPRSCIEAIDACRKAREAFEFNPNESLLLERLLMYLPAAKAS